MFQKSKNLSLMLRLSWRRLWQVWPEPKNSKGSILPAAPSLVAANSNKVFGIRSAPEQLDSPDVGSMSINNELGTFSKGAANSQSIPTIPSHICESSKSPYEGPHVTNSSLTHLIVNTPDLRV